jgi:hypothetical protein
VLLGAWSLAAIAGTTAFCAIPAVPRMPKVSRLAGVVMPFSRLPAIKKPGGSTATADGSDPVWRA